jgi:hypothetical protein
MIERKKKEREREREREREGERNLQRTLYENFACSPGRLVCSEQLNSNSSNNEFENVE